MSPVPMPHPWQAKKRSSDPASLGHAPAALGQNAKTGAATLHGGLPDPYILHFSASFVLYGGTEAVSIHACWIGKHEVDLDFGA